MYNIEIEVICLWQKKRLKSPKVALNISTGHIKGKDLTKDFCFCAVNIPLGIHL
jgi:hypothetical protein